MTSPVNMDYERAVKEALTEPGKIHAAYQTFWQYSSSNQILAMWQLGKAEPISTCPGWKRIGRNVKKGEAIALLMPVTGRKIDEESGEEQRRMFFVSRAGADPVTAPRFMDIDGKRYLWRELVERGKAQVKKAAIPEQPTLFAEHEDRRPPGERSAAETYDRPLCSRALERSDSGHPATGRQGRIRRRTRRLPKFQSACPANSVR